MMGFNSNRVVLSSRTLPASGGRKPSSSNESVCESNGSNRFPSGKRKNLSNDASIRARDHYRASSFGAKSKGKMSAGSLRGKFETEKPWTLKYGKDKKYSARLNRVADVELDCKSNRSPSAKIPLPSKTLVHNEKTEKLGRKENGVSNPCHTHHSPCRPDSTKPVNSHSSPSSTSFSSRESPTSVIWKRERGSTAGKCNSMKAPVNLDNGSIPKENSGMSHDSKNGRHLPSNARNCQHSGSALSFGNIYRGFKNAIVEADPSHAKETHQNKTVPRFKSEIDGKGKDSETVRSNSNVLGFGRCNYGHGSIIKGAMNVESCPGTNYLTIGSNKGEDQLTFPAPSVTPNSKNAEELRNAGNDEYRKGRFTEAISLYDRAIALCPRDALCHNNKAAALAGLRRYSEAVGECLDAIECDPSYSRAHYRLGSLYTRFGRVEDAKWHFKLSGQQPDSEVMHMILHIESHLLNMSRARNAEDWNRVLAESTWAIDAGANASDQVLAYKAEALLKLHKAKEALDLLTVAKRSEIDKSRKTHKGDSCLLIIETQVYMYLGRFDDGVMAAERAANLDCRPELLMWLKKARAVADARKTGNELFKAGKYLEACEAYGQGLEHAPTNSILLSNRAACRSKLGQWEMAVEDCNAALRNRPNYTKALLRRAHSNAKLERWEESLRDYKVLSQEMPGDISIAHSLLQVQTELKRFRGEPSNLPLGGQVTEINSYSQLLKVVKLAGRH
ncbi:TPR repeat-containing thioredoxin TTL1-like isoform X2 [Magnolia sinica]|uniref:TPR repeat-containing thioredoxin TTL1-like isoform X2 n=1 Tax=Magnolia sinica TaxID=86752 RepID=UPI002657D862|nr:TPR repeat-containing thioredoxin TTL1-like isoform X2 [Magnolia sinica]